MKQILKIIPLIAIFFLFSCEDDWNKHYDRNEALPEQNLMELIKKDGSLSKFAELIAIAGYDSLLTSSQTYTVWAPQNEALAGIDATNKVQVTQLVGNHIARFNHSTTESEDQVIRMVNGKVHYYSHQGGITFGGSQLVQKDQLAKNGLLHTIDNSLKYSYNIYEYMLSQSNTSKVAAFITSYIEEIKTEVGYDTLVFRYNPLLESFYYGLGDISAEDSLFTMIIPTNDAWDAAYERIAPYFKVYNADAELADSIQRVQTSLAIINDLIYRGKIEEPELRDTLVSTGGSVIRQPQDLFLGTTPINMSNGVAFLTNEIRYNNTETWDKPIKMECEWQGRRITGSYTSIYTRTVDIDSPVQGVSNGRYIEVQPTNTSAQPYVVFEMVNALSGKYDIYVDFIPAIVDGESFANDSTKLSFRISYLNDKGKEENQNFTSDSFVTSGTKKVRMKVADAFQLPISNYYDRMWDYNAINDVQQQVEITTKFRISTNVTAKQVNDNIFTRKFRVDRIIFEPIEN